MPFLPNKLKKVVEWPSMSEAKVILVDEQGEKIGTCDHLEAHTSEGKLHKAFSVYVFRDRRRELLIQRRSRVKMLWPLIWANTCCSHLREEEMLRAAGEKRLKEEMGFTCPLAKGPSFVYREEDPNHRGVEHEHVTILIGDVENVEGVTIVPNPDEVAAYEWANVEKLLLHMKTNPDEYAPWLHIGLNKILTEQ